MYTDYPSLEVRRRARSDVVAMTCPRVWLRGNIGGTGMIGFELLVNISIASDVLVCRRAS